MTLSMVHAVSRLAQAVMNATPGTYKSFVEISSIFQLKQQIALLKPGEYMVVVFDPRKSRFGKLVVKKLMHPDRGRHRFVYASGSFVRRYAKQSLRIFIVNSRGVMVPVRYFNMVQSKLRQLEGGSAPRPTPRPVSPVPRPVPPPPKPQPVVKPKPIVKPRLKQTRKVASLPGVVRFCPFGMGLFCFEVKTKRKPQPSSPPVRPRVDTKVDSDADTDIEAF